MQEVVCFYLKILFSWIEIVTDERLHLFVHIIIQYIFYYFEYYLYTIANLPRNTFRTYFYGCDTVTFEIPQGLLPLNRLNELVQ